MLVGTRNFKIFVDVAFVFEHRSTPAMRQMTLDDEQMFEELKSSL